MLSGWQGSGTRDGLAALRDSLPARGESLIGFRACPGGLGVQNGRRRAVSPDGGAMGVPTIGLTTEGRAAGWGALLRGQVALASLRLRKDRAANAYWD